MVERFKTSENGKPTDFVLSRERRHSIFKEKKLRVFGELGNYTAEGDYDGSVRLSKCYFMCNLNLRGI